MVNAILVFVIADRVKQPVFRQLANSDMVVDESSPVVQDKVKGESTDGVQGDVFVVERVIDGDTIQLSNGEKVRYIGVDSPELGSKNGECYAQEAKRANGDLVLGKKIELVKDVSETDKYQRLLRYVYVEPPGQNVSSDAEAVKGKSEGQAIFVNEYLVREGYARVATYPPDVKYKDVFLQAQDEAWTEKRGLWSECF